MAELRNNNGLAEVERERARHGLSVRKLVTVIAAGLIAACWWTLRP